MAEDGFRVAISVKRVEDDKSVVFKMDGKRFEQQYTLKLNAATKYCVSMTMSSARPLLSVALQGEALEINQKDGTDNDHAVYTTQWTSPPEQRTAKGAREKYQLTLNATGFSEVVVPLQVKFYPTKETQHSRWGSTLTEIQLHCSRLKDSGLTEVSDLAFR